MTKLLLCICLTITTAFAADLPAGDWVRHGFTDAQRQELLRPCCGKRPRNRKSAAGRSC